MAIEISQVELLALKKLAIVSGALAQQLSAPASAEQRALTRVLADVIARAEIDNARAALTSAEGTP